MHCNIKFHICRLDAKINKIYKHVRPHNTRMEMYAGCVACCPLVSDVEYTPRALLRLEKTVQTNRRTDHYIMLTARCGQLNNQHRSVQC